ncbi:formate dehydrogenase subunit gamma [Cupriavidus basilensis]
MIERFTPFERIVHWTMAISFVLLAISGIVMLFGKHFMLPVMGHTLFGWLTYLLKNIHNLAGPVFTLSIIVAFAIFVRDNIPSRDDVRWVTSLGGLASGKHVPSGRFNAGEKMWFWGGLVIFGADPVRVGLGARHDRAGSRLLPRDDADRQRDPWHCCRADDRHVAGPHLHGHHRHGRSLPRDARRLGRRGLGQGTPRALVRRHQDRQDPGPTLGNAGTRHRRPAQRGRGLKHCCRPAFTDHDHETHPDADCPGRRCPGRAGQAAAADRRRRRPRPKRPRRTRRGPTRWPRSSCARRRTRPLRTTTAT